MHALYFDDDHDDLLYFIYIYILFMLLFIYLGWLLLTVLGWRNFQQHMQSLQNESQHRLDAEHELLQSVH